MKRPESPRTEEKYIFPEHSVRLPSFGIFQTYLFTMSVQTIVALVVETTKSKKIIVPYQK